MSSNGPSPLARLRAVGPDDRVFDGLLAGPVVVVLLALLGRTPASKALAGSYLLVLVVRIGQHALVAEGDES